MPPRRWMSLLALLGTGFAAPALRASPATVVRAGAPYAIDALGSEQGLPQSSVIAMTQTRDGYLWLGTLNGLARFDGVHFKVFDESNTPELGSSPIVSLFEDREGSLWVGTEMAGVVRIKNGRAESLGIGRGSSESRLVSACQDAAGAVWLMTADGWLWRLRGGRVDKWRGGTSAPSALIADNSGSLWVGMRGALYSFDPAQAVAGRELVRENESASRTDFLLASAKGGHWRLADESIQRWTTNRPERISVAFRWPKYTPVTTACEDREGNLVVGTRGAGVFWFDTQGRSTDLSTNEGLANSFVLSVHLDREGTLWMGTDGGGLNRLRRQVFDVIEPCLGWVVRAACEDAEGGLWIGANVNGVARWKEGVLQRIPLAHYGVRSVLADRAGRVWAGTWGIGLQQVAGRQLEIDTPPMPPRIAVMHEDRERRLWVGTESGLVRREATGAWTNFTREQGLSANSVQALADDAEGGLWIGTVGGGLNRMRDGQFTVFRKTDGCPSDDISALCVDGDGVVWTGTFGSGLGRFSKGRWTRYTTRDGLISNSVGYLIEDGQGNLWIGSNLGLMRVAKKALNEFAEGATRFIPCRTFNTTDGLPSSECSLGSACRTRDGRMWFPTIAGVASVDPAQLKPNPVPPPVAIEAVLIDGQAQNGNGLRTTWLDALTIPAEKERLEIQYTSLNLSSAARARFKYQMEGHETGWTEVNDRVVRYSKLPPGHYRFHVTACNEDGVWNETGSALAIVVLPPFWRTWWFLTITTLALLVGIVGVVHYLSTQKLQRQLAQLRQQEAVEKERGRIARDIHDQLGASLTQVSLLGELVESDKNSPADVEAHARQISQTARETTRALDEIVWTVNPSNDTLEGLINYVCKYAQDYLAVAGLRYRLDVPAQLPPTPLPPEMRHNVFLAAKESVTNVVRHAQAGAVWIRLRLEPGRFTLEIEDDGRGPGDLEARSHRNGLRNMRKRMEDVGGEFSIGPGSERGTLVRLTAPLAKR